MNNIEQYKKRFFNLMESTIGDVRQLINEQSAIPGNDTQVQSLPQEFQTFVKQYGLTGTFNETGQSSSGEYGYNKGNVHTGFNISEIKTYEEHKGDYQKCIERNKEYKTIYHNFIRDKNNAPRGLVQNGKEEADKQINQKYPNMEYCGVVIKMQDIVNNK
jgi:hypothetical protein